jgi:phosphate/sulfate permease
VTGTVGVVGSAGTIGPVDMVEQPASTSSADAHRRSHARPLESRSSSRSRAGREARRNRSIMSWILLEAAVALAIGLFIVWWTWPKKK